MFLTQLNVKSYFTDSTLTRLNTLIFLSDSTLTQLNSSTFYPTRLKSDSFESELSQISDSTHESSTTLLRGDGRGSDNNDSGGGGGARASEGRSVGPLLALFSMMARRGPRGPVGRPPTAGVWSACWPEAILLSALED